MTAHDRHGATSVVDRDMIDSGTADGPMTRDIPLTRDVPLPPRSLRIGLAPSASPAPAAPVSADFEIAPAPLVHHEPSPAAAEARTATDRPAPPKPPSPVKRSGDRRSGPPSSLKARTALIAVAAGAAAAAVAGSSTHDATAADPAPAENAPAPALAANSADLDGGAVPAASHADMDGFGTQLTVGKQLASAQAAREAASRKPMYAAPITAKYAFTSGYANRWGSFHGGLDLAAPLGTPIHAVTDGTVINAGPASGYGNWVQVKAADGTVTMYGHMASSGVLVKKGQKVTAGDVIALVGSEGFSTGPHLHFEVWKNGTTKVDPAPWLAQRGVKLNSYTG